MRIPSLTLGGLMLSAALTAAQAPTVQPVPPVTFKMDINYVDVSVRVLDEQGAFVPNLTKEDFRIFEDKRPQTIDAFGLVSLAFQRPEKPVFLPRPVDSDIVVNTRGNEGRLYVLALDDLHTDPLRSQRVRNAARKFIEEHLSANDLAAVTVIGRSDAAQELTGNRRLLLAAVDRFVGQQPRAATLEMIDAYNRAVASGGLDPGGDVSDPLLQERLSNDKRSLRSLTRLADWMGAVHGRRKALVYFSEGMGYDVADVFRSMTSAVEPRKADVLELFDNTRDVISAATRNDVNIYAVDPRGLSAAGDVLIEAGNVADTGMARNVDDPNFGGGTATFRADLGAQSLARELEAAHNHLRTLSEETGGFATLNANEFTTAFDRIVDENGSYYVLGYYSKNEKRDGKYRAIDVRLPNRPKLVVRARKGYLASRGKTAKSSVATDEAPDVTARLRDVLRSPVPVGDLAFSATAASFKGTSPNNTVVVTVEISGKDLGLVAKNGIFAGSLAVALVVLDAEGKLKASAAPTLALTLRPETYNYVAKDGNFRVVAQFALPVGRYVLRAAALSGDGKNSGGVQYDLEVPDFTRTPVALSNIALMSARAGLSPTAADDHLDQKLPQPTTLREFASDDELTVYVEAYDNQPGPIHSLDLVSTVQASDGRVVFKNEQERSSEEMPSVRGVPTRIPLKGLSPGLYVLTVEARSRLGNAEPVSQRVQFRLR